MSFADSSVIITGASQGIGREIARVFVEHTNHPLILIARNKSGLEETKILCQEKDTNQIVTLPCDLTDSVAVSNLDIPEYMAEPGIIVNNAGYFLLKKLQATSSEEFRGQFSSNAITAFNLTQRFLPDLKRQDRGLIVNICSMEAIKGKGSSGAYAASKHALLGYTRSLRKELLDSQIAVTAINLGQTYSTSWKGMNVDPNQLIDPSDVGKLIVALSEFSPRTVAEEITMRPQHGEIPPDGF